MRGELRAWLDCASGTTPLSPTDVGDIDLVVTELAANVIDHTDSPWVEVTVTAAASGLTVEVLHDGDAVGLPAIDSWDRIAGGERGRGLRIVRALCQEIEVVHGENGAAIRCRMLS